MREAWTDERLDDLNSRVADMGRRMDEGFNRIHVDIRDLRREMDAKIDGLQRMIVQVGGGMVATFVVGFLGVIVVQL
jgi:hypothetical protein